MAYDPKQREEKENPYAALAGHDVGSPIPDSMRPATASAAPLPGGEAGPTSTGHVNFDQIYNANAGTAAREANKLQTSARMQGQAVRTGVMGAQDQFGQAVRTGAMGGPNQSQQNWAKTGSTGVKPAQIDTVPNLKAPKANAHQSKEGAEALADWTKNLANFAGSAKSNTTPTASPENLGTVGVDLNWGGKPPGVVDNPDAQNPELSGDVLRQQVEAGAGQTYGGPNALSDLGQYEQLLQDATAAQDRANALGKGNAGLQALGMNRLDAALLGASGRRGFEDIAKDQSNLKGELGAANLASKGLADTEKQQREQDAAAYQGLLDEFGGRVSADQAGEDKKKKANQDAIAAADKKYKDQLAYNQAIDESNSGINGFRNELHKIANAASLSSAALNAAGEKSTVDAGGEWFGQSFLGDQADGFNAGNRSQAWGEDDGDVFGSMTAADWTEFNALGLADQKAWIAARKKKLAGGG